MQEEELKIIENNMLDLNKNGLSYLTKNLPVQAHDYFKQAQKKISEALRNHPDQQKLNQLAGITYNNLACYYKKNAKPKVALTYLKKALEIQVYKVQDWTSTASTHLNICAIYSYLKKHQEAADHAQLAISMLEKIDVKNLKGGSADNEKSYWNIKMLSHYNLAVELEHLKKFVVARKQFELARETAFNNKQKNENIIKSIEESLDRIDDSQAEMKRRLSELLAKRKLQEEKGNHQFMRRNKKHYGDQGEWRAIIENKKYELYKTEDDHRRHYQSTGKVRKLAPIVDGSKSKRGLENH